MAKNSSDNPWKKATIIVIAIAVILQIITYKQYFGLQTAVADFINGERLAKTDSEEQQVVDTFLKAVRGHFTISNSGAFWGIHVKKWFQLTHYIGI